jgi:hypothetical protein
MHRNLSGKGRKCAAGALGGSYALFCHLPLCAEAGEQAESAAGALSRALAASEAESCAAVAWGGARSASVPRPYRAMPADKCLCTNKYGAR